LGVLLLVAVALAAETGTIEGRLLNGDGTPWEGAQVTAYKLGEKTPWKGVAETDKEGRFRLADLPPGRYVLRHAPKPKPQPKDSPLGELFKGMFDDLLQVPMGEDDPDAIAVEAGQTVRKDIRLPMKAPVQFVITHRGKPLAGAEVEVFRVNADNKPGWKVTVGGERLPRTSREGVASFGEIDEGRYAVEVKVGQWSVYGGVHEVKGSEPRSFPVQLGEYSVRVKVLDGRGEPAPEAMVSVWWSEGAWDFVRSRDMKELSSRDGVHRVPYVRAGKVRVWVNGPGDSCGGCEGIEIGPGSQEPETIVRLDATATLVIRVVDAKGRPVPGIHVRIENADEEKGRPGFGYDVDKRGEHRQVVTLRRWRVRIEDFDRGNGEWTIVKPEANEERAVVLTLPR
jgi:protocatechuate 3,4-dioxygenase beta subunit